MILDIVSFDGNAINDGTNFTAWLPSDMPWSPENTPEYSARARMYPTLAGVDLNPWTIPICIRLLGNVQTQKEQIKQWFSTKDQTTKKLLVQDLSDSNRQWRVFGVPSKIAYDKTVVTIILSLDDPEWTTEVENHVAWSVTATGQTSPAITTRGIRKAHPRIGVTATQAKTGTPGYSAKRFVPIYNPLSLGYWTSIDITNGGLNTQALVTAGKIQASGADIQVMIDNVAADYWFGGGGMNSTTTEIFVNLFFSPKQELNLLGSLSNTGPITTINVKKNAAMLKVLKTIPQSNGTLYSGTEAFTYTGVDQKNYAVTGVTPAAKGTSRGNHADNDVFRWIEHDICLLYNNPTATAPIIDNTKQPIFDLATSTNSSWVFSQFKDLSGLRFCPWKATVISTSGKLSNCYTGPSATLADPATEAGMQMLAWQKSGRWQAENASLEWRFYHPAGITAVTATGQKLRHTTSWPATCGLRKSLNGTAWTNVWQESSPASVDTWTAWNTHTAVSLAGSFPYVDLVMTGTLAASDSNEADSEAQSVTLALDSTKTPVVTLGPELANYYLAATITNQTTGESYTVTYWVTINDTLTADGMTYSLALSDNTKKGAVIAFSTIRDEWLDLLPGVANTLKFDDPGTNGVTVDVYWRDRSVGP
ncbi:MAG: hypothetical protein P4L50_03245 [Anaerolineaceae bacterium]|nr:hypothetical protein [Anaerolineaceae bacterium]